MSLASPKSALGVQRFSTLLSLLQGIGVDSLVSTGQSAASFGRLAALLWYFPACLF